MKVLRREMTRLDMNFENIAPVMMWRTKGLRHGVGRPDDQKRYNSDDQ
jgi:hypothetical protein